jgi:hypothetical protein
MSRKSMTMHAKDDPNDVTELCMRCCAVEPYRTISSFSNDLRLYLCYPCQKELLALVEGWLDRTRTATGTTIVKGSN